MKEVYLSRLRALKESSGLSFAALSQKTGISDSTLSRWFKGDGSPDLDDLELICTALGGQFRDILADVGEAEMEAAKKVDYMGTDALLAEFEKREQLLRQHCSQAVQHQIDMRQNLEQSFSQCTHALREAHADFIKAEKDKYTSVTSYLKLQIDRFRRSTIVFLCLFIFAVVLLAIFIAIDAPQIGAGW